MHDAQSPPNRASGAASLGIKTGERCAGLTRRLAFLSRVARANVEPQQGTWLLWFDSEGALSRFQVCARRIVVGRAPRCDCVVDDPRVSRQHCVLVANGETLLVRDLRSSNGTFVNDLRILGGNRRLFDGGVLSLGGKRVACLVYPTDMPDSVRPILPQC